MNDWRPFVYGGLASVAAEFGTFPIDLTKSRLQVQGQVADSNLRNLKYRGMIHAITTIAREEGPRALYSGLSPAVLRQATYGTIKIGIYHTMKRAIVKDPKDETLFYNVLCGIVAGIVSSSIANPTDVLKVRMQINRKETSKMGMWKSFADIYRLEGVRGLWRGVGPTAQRAAVVCGVELPVYDVIKKKILHSGYLGDTKETHFISSFIAGFAGAVACNPIDVCKTRMMNQKRLKLEPAVVANATGPAQPAVIYKSALDVVVRTVRTEGFMALYKGFIPNWLRLGPWNIIFFMTYEQLKKIY